MIHGKIIQGTTPDLEFSLPIPPEEIKDIRISFSQKGKNILTKELYECKLDKKKGTINLTLEQEESYLFTQKKGIVTVRIKVLLLNDKVIASDEILLLVEDTADKAVMY